MITYQPGACMGSQAWSKRDVTQLHAKREVKVKCNTSMHQAIITYTTSVDKVVVAFSNTLTHAIHKQYNEQ